MDAEPPQNPLPNPTSTALPVALRIADPTLAADVAAYVEGQLGWQVVVNSPDLPARLVLTDQVDACGGAVLVARQPSPELAAAAGRAGARDVTSWPPDAGRLSSLVPAEARRIAGSVTLVRGSAGGVGTTTLALAVAACHSWSDRPTWLVAGAEARRMSGLPVGPPVAVHPSLPGLTLVGHPRDLLGRSASDDVVVVDVGATWTGARMDPPPAPAAPAPSPQVPALTATAARTEVLVARPDRHLLAALATCRPSVVVTVGEGALHDHERARAVAGLAHLHLRWQFRVARDGLRGRLPGGFPGRLVAQVRDAIVGSAAAAPTPRRSSRRRGSAA